MNSGDATLSITYDEILPKCKRDSGYKSYWDDIYKKEWIKNSQDWDHMHLYHYNIRNAITEIKF